MSVPAEATPESTPQRKSTLGTTVLLVVTFVLFVMTFAMLASNPGATARDVVRDTEDLAQDAMEAAATVPDADEFAVGTMNAEGEFEAFLDNVAPEDVTEFVFQVRNSTEGITVTETLEKPEELVVRIDAIKDVPGEFTVSAFDEDAQTFHGPSFTKDEAVVYSSVIKDFQD